MNNRRKLIIALGAGALAAPLASFSQQQGKVWRIGYLFMGSRPASLDTGNIGTFRRGMRDLGYVEGKNLLIEWRFADQVERLPELAMELVRSKVDVIVAQSTPTVQALQKATTTIPIVMTGAGDPVGSGLVKSLARPGGNITGMSQLTTDTSAKRLEMLVSMVPKLSRVAYLMPSPNRATMLGLEAYQDAGRKLGVNVMRVEAQTPQEIVSAFSSLAKDRIQAIIVSLDSLFVSQRREIAELAAKHGLPSIQGNAEYAEAGGLMAYGVNSAEMYKRAASYVDKILKGANPADLPVEQPTTFEMVINAKTAKALGLKIPQSLLVRADKVIE